MAVEGRVQCTWLPGALHLQGLAAMKLKWEG
jgi:hypothetical protein